MRYLLNVAYLILLAAVAPLLLYRALRFGKYRRGWRQKLWGAAPLREGDATCVWLHAVSMGEAHLLEPVVKELREARPDAQLFISTTTDTGFAAAQRKFPDAVVFYCPLDFSWSVRRAMRSVRPDLLVLAELELWPNLITAASEQNAKVAVINGRLSERSARGYARVSSLAKWMLARIDLLAVQNDEYAQRFLRLGAPKETTHVTGSVKFDGAVLERDNPQTQRLAKLARVSAEDIVFHAGSTQHPEERFALQAYLSLRERFPQLRLWITPRHPERFDEVAAMLDQSGVDYQRRSRLVEGEEATARVVLIDAMGELRDWWGATQIAYVGGSMGARGGQNMIEPAASGAAVSFGPLTHNFREVVSQLLAADAARVVRDENELIAFVEACASDPRRAALMGQRARRLVKQQQGAARRTSELLVSLLPADEVRRAA